MALNYVIVLVKKSQFLKVFMFLLIYCFTSLTIKDRQAVFEIKGALDAHNSAVGRTIFRHCAQPIIIHLY